MTIKGIKYLASPYSAKLPDGSPDFNLMEYRFRCVCRAAARLKREGHLIFSPIAMSHPIALYGHLPGTWEEWKELDLAMIDRCDEVWILELDGFDTSKGVNGEWSRAYVLDKPIKYIDPTPADLGDQT